MFPKSRHRRMRIHPALREAVQETRLSADQLIMPFFIQEGIQKRTPIPSMPGIEQLSLDQFLKDVKKAERVGIRSILLFGLPQKKDSLGKQAYADSGIIQKAIRMVKKSFPKMIVMADLCFCEYTSHGHCGVVVKSKSGWDVDNDKTLSLIRKTAVAQARAGVDLVAPSGMMDGAVKHIRAALDQKGFKQTGILAYAAKYSSHFYGPFRDAALSTPQFGDRRTYQMNYGNAREALKEIQSDIAEGADMVMVKPALSYLDIIYRARQMCSVPLVAYNVSGEYAMVKAAEKNGWLGQPNHPVVALEILTSIKRAGADLIITYHALDVASYLANR